MLFKHAERLYPHISDTPLPSPRDSLAVRETGKDSYHATIPPKVYSRWAGKTPSALADSKGRGLGYNQ